MRKKITANDCKAIFNDRFNSLSSKELGIELKHFAMGTAPENPSFLVNQDELKKVIIEKLCNFFDENKSQGLEIVFLKSNYGNGKSHFIRTIYTFLNEYENVIAKIVSLKQEETDLKKRILESVSQKRIMECANYIVESVQEEVISDESIAVVNMIVEKYELDIKLARLLYEIARGESVERKIQAIAILKGNYEVDYIKKFDLQKHDLNNDFYYNVIRIILYYFQQRDLYLVVVFDEYEHVCLWKDSRARNSMYEDIKLFSDNIRKLENMFMVFAESDSVDNTLEFKDDPAFMSRKASMTYEISDLSSETEVDRLFKMILKRYEKYYNLALDRYVDDIKEMINEDPLIGGKTNYRAYTQATMRVLDFYRNKPPKLKKKNNAKSLKQNIEVEAEDINFENKWLCATSISKKTILCDVIKQGIEQVGGRVLSIARKQGKIEVEINNDTRIIFVISTDIPSTKDLDKRMDSFVSESMQEDVLYPYFDECKNLKYENVTFYDSDTVIKMERNLNTKDQIYESYENFLKGLDIRSKNVQEN